MNAEQSLEHGSWFLDTVKDQRALNYQHQVNAKAKVTIHDHFDSFSKPKLGSLEMFQHLETEFPLGLGAFRRLCHLFQIDRLKIRLRRHGELKHARQRENRHAQSQSDKKCPRAPFTEMQKSANHQIPVSLEFGDEFSFVPVIDSHCHAKSAISFDGTHVWQARETNRLSAKLIQQTPAFVSILVPQSIEIGNEKASNHC